MRTSTRLAATLLSAALALTALTGCSKGPLDITCSEFLALSQSQRVDIATQWSIKDGSAKEMAEMLAESTADGMASYCQDNPDTKISELERTYG